MEGLSDGGERAIYIMEVDMPTRGGIHGEVDDDGKEKRTGK